MINSIGGVLWQWDTGRQVQIKPKRECTIKEVHFNNGTTVDALKVKIDTADSGGVVIASIPDVLLQSSNFLKVYSFEENECGGRTEQRALLEVYAREKPETYIFTPEEKKTWESLAARVTELEEDAQFGALIETDMLPAVYNADGAILTNEENQIILRY